MIWLKQAIKIKNTMTTPASLGSRFIKLVKQLTNSEFTLALRLIFQKLTNVILIERKCLILAGTNKRNNGKQEMYRLR